jgi:hypothetical protein
MCGVFGGLAGMPRTGDRKQPAGGVVVRAQTFEPVDDVRHPADQRYLMGRRALDLVSGLAERRGLKPDIDFRTYLMGLPVLGFHAHDAAAPGNRAEHHLDPERGEGA